MVALRQTVLHPGPWASPARARRASTFALLVVIVTTVAFAAGLSGTTPWAHVATPHFLSKALGKSQPDAKLVRHSAGGTTLVMGGSSFGIRHGAVSFGLAAQGVSGARWQTYANGVGRATPFGRETVTVGRSKIEQFLTVGKHVGTRTWRWQFTGLPSDLTPRVGDDGYVAFLVGNGAIKQLSQDAFIAPPAILDARGHRIPAKYLHWTVAQAGGKWWLNLRVNDAKLPMPYVIDPIAIRGTATTGTRAPSNTTVAALGPTGVVAGDVMVADVSSRSNTAVTSNSPAFTQTGSNVTNGTGLESSVWYRVAGAADSGATFTWTTPNVDSAVGIIAFSGVDNSNPFNISTSATGTTATPNGKATASSITTTVANTEIVALYAAAGTSGTTAPTLTQDASQNVTGQYTAVADEGMHQKDAATTGSAGTSVQASAGATGTFTATINLTTTPWIAHTLALQPPTTCTSCSWTGGGGNNNWSTGANWSGGLPPATNGTATLTFPSGQSQPTNNNDFVGASFAGIVLSGSGYTLGGNQITLGTSGIADSVTSGGNTVSLPVAAGAVQPVSVTNSGETLTLSGVYSGTGGGITKSGSGALTLSGPNTMTGGVTLSAGQLNINNATALGTGTFTISGGTIDNTSGGAITESNNNVQSWSGDFTFAGSNALNLGTGNVTLTAARQVTVTASNLTVGGVVSGAFKLTKAGSGTLTLGGANTFTGGVALTAGQLNINNASALGTTAGTFTISGGTTIDNTSGSAITTSNYPMSWAGDFTFVGSNDLNLGTGNAPMTASRSVTVNAGTLTVGGVISGTNFGITKLGAGTLADLGNNTYTGNTTITAGILNADATASLGGASNQLIFNGGTLQASGAISSPSTRAVSVASATGTIDTNGFTVSLAGNVTGANGLTKISSGALQLSGTNTFLGGVSLNGGELDINSTTALGTGTLTISGGTTIDNTSGGSLAESNNNAQAWNGDFTFGGSNDLNLGTGAVTMSASRQVTTSSTHNLTVGGAISGSGFSLTKAGAGTLTLSGGNTFTGGTTLSAGQLNINNATALGTGTFTISGGTIDNTSGGSITESNNNAQAWNGNFTFTGSNALNLGTGAVTLGASRQVTVSGSVLTVGGAISGSTFGLTKSGAGTLTLTGANTYTGNTTITAGVLNANSSSALGDANNTLVFAGGTLQAGGTITSPSTRAVSVSSATALIDTTSNPVSIAGVISGANGLSKGGSATLTLTGTNTYSGSTTISAGALNANSSAAIGDGSSTNTLVFTGGTLQAGGTIASPSTRTVTLTAPGTIDSNGNSVSIAGVISGGTSLSKTGSGALALSATNTFTGGFSLTGGEVDVNNTQALGTSASTVTITGGTTIDNTSGSSITTVNYPQNWNGDFTFAGSNALNLGTGAVAMNASRQVTVTASTLTVGGIISGSGFGLTKAGNGTLVLTGANTYTGNTTIAAGTLNANSTSALGGASNQLIFSGGTLQAGGSIASPSTRAVSVASATGTIDTNGQTVSIAGVISGANGLTKNGAATLTLSGANTFQGGLTLNAGQLNINSATALGTGTFTIAGATTIDNSSGGALTESNNNAQAWNGDFTFQGSNDLNLGTGNVTMSASRVVAVASHNLTVGGVISGSTFGLTKAGTGTLTLAGANTFTGGTTLSAGQLNINNSSALGTTAGTFTIAGGTTIDNTSGSAITTVDYPQVWNGGFTFAGSNALNLGAGAVSLTGSRTVTTTANNLTVGGVISGSTFGLTKAGAGTLTLTGANTYTGNTTISGGTLNANSSSALGDANNTLVIGGATLQAGGAITSPSTRAVTLTNTGTIDTNGNAVEIDGVISGANALTKIGSGTLTLTNTNTYSGATTITAGTLNANSSSAIGDGSATNTLVFNGAGTLQAGGTISSPSARGVTLSAGGAIDTNGNTVSIAGVITGGNGLIKNGSGTLKLSGTNTFTGGFNLSGGEVDVNSAQALGTSLSTFSIAPGTTIDNTSGSAITTVNYPQIWGGDFTFVGSNALNLGTGSVGMTGSRNVTVSASTLTIGGAISGAGFGITKLGNGTLADLGNNTYTGNTTITAGTLNADASASLGGSSNQLIFNGGTLQASGTITSPSTRAVSVAAATGTIDTAGNTVSLAGAVSGTNGLTKIGSGALQLSGTNTFQGGVALNTGELDINSATALGTGTLTISGGTTIDSTSANTTESNNNPQAWNGDFTFNGTKNLNLGTGAVTMSASRQVTVSGGVLTVGGVIGGSGFSLTKAGAGELALAGANTFTGGTTLNAGQLDINNAQALGTAAGTFTIAGGTIDNTSGGAITTLNYPQAWNGDFTFGGTNALNLGTGAVTLGGSRQVTASGASALTVGGAISGSGFSLTKAGSGELALAGANTFTGGVTLNAGQLDINNATALGTGTFTIAHDGVTIDNTSGGPLTESNNNVQSWAGNFTFTGSSNLNLGTGAVTLGKSLQVSVTANRLIVGGAIGGSFSLTKAGSGALALGGANTFNGGFSLNAGEADINNATALGTGTFTIAAGTTIDNTSGGTITESNNNAQTWSGNFTFTGSNNLNLGTGAVSAARTVTVTAGNLTVGGAIAGGNLGKAGNGTLTLTGNSAYAGTTTISAGTLNASSSTAIGNGSNTNTLIFSGGTLQAGGTINSPSSRPVTLSSTATVDTNGNSVLLAGVISGPGIGLTKIGSGTLTLGGTNTYTGTTTVSAGTLAVNGAQGGSAVSLNGGTLSGTGTTGAVTSTASGGTLAPGTPPGILNTGSVNLSTGSPTFSVALNGTVAGTTYSQDNVTGSVNLTGATLAASVGYSPVYNDSYTIISNDGADAVTGTFAGLPNGSSVVLGGKSFRIQYNGGDGNDVVLLAGGATKLAVTSVPASTPTNTNFSVTVQSQDSSGNCVQVNSNTNVSLSLGSGAGTLSGNTGTILAGTCSVTLSSVQIDRGGQQTITLKASATSGDVLAQSAASSGILVSSPPTAVSFSGASMTAADVTTWTEQFTASNAGALSGGSTVTVTFDPAFSGNIPASPTVTLGGSFSGTCSSPAASATGAVVTVTLPAGCSLANSATGTVAIAGITNPAAATYTASNFKLHTSSDTIDASPAGNITINPRCTSCTWTGGGANNNWSTGANWSGGNAPATDGSATLTFPNGASRLSNTNDFTAGTAFAGLVISGSGYTLAGNQVTLGSSGISDSTTSGGSTIGLALTSAAARTVSVTNAAENLTLSGVYSGTGGGITKSGSGTLTVSGTNTYTGNTTISAGTLNANASAALGNASNTLVFNGGTLQAGGTITSPSTRSVTLSATGTIDTNGNPISIAGVISGANGLTKNGSGTLTLTGTNTYSGATTIAAGTLNANASAALGDESSTNTLAFAGGTLQAAGAITSPSTRPVSVSSATALIDTTGNVVEIDGVISGANGVTKSGGSGGALTLTGNNTYSGATTISAGNLNATSSAALGDASATNTLVFNGGALQAGGTIASPSTRAVTLSAPGTIFTSGNTVSIAGVISGGSSNSLLKTDPGTLTLSGANTFQGGLQLNTGTLNINNATALGTGTFTIAGGTIDNTSGGSITETNNNAQSWNNDFTFTGSNDLNLGTGAVTLSASRQVTVTSHNLTVGGAISGSALGLTKAGAGTLTLTGSNTYSGSTTISGGTLNANSSAALGSGGASNTLVFSGGTLQAGGTITSSATRPVTASSTGTIDTNGNAVSIAGVIGGTGSLTKIGSGALTLRGANTFQGGLTFNAGTLNINNATALGTGTLTIAGGTIDNTSAGAITESNNNAQAWNGDFTFAGTKDLNLGTGAVTMSASRQVTVSGGTLTVGGAISGSGFGLTKAGTGTLALAGSNTYTGNTTISAGTLNASSSSALGDANNTLVFSGGTLQAGGTITSPSTRNVTLPSTGTIDTNGNSVSIAGVISGANGLTEGGSGTLALSGTNTYSGATTLNGGTLNASSSAALGDGSATNTLVFSGGTLQAGGTIASPSTRSVSVSSATGTIDTNGNPVSIAGVIGGANGVTKNGTGTLTLTGASTYSGATTISAGTVNANASAALGDESATNTLVFVGGTLQAGGTIASPSTRPVDLVATGTIDTTGNGVSIAGTISDTGSLTKSGAGTLTLTGTNTYSGSTTISGGTLNASASAAIGDGSATNTLVFSGGTLKAGGTIASPSTRGVTLSATGTIDTNGNPVSIAGVISGGNGLTKTGSGTLTLTANNTYSGTTTVSAGTLTVNGSQGSSAVSLDGGTLKGTGTTGAVTSTASGGTLSPGAPAPGILNTGSVDLSSGSPTFSVALNGTTAGSGYSQDNVTGTVNLTGATLSASLGYTPTNGDSYTLISNDGSDPVTGTFAGLPEGTGLVIGGYSFRISYVGGDGNDVVLTAGGATKLAVTSVPANATANVNFSVTVQSQDANGNCVQVNSNTGISLASDGAGSLSGTTGTIAAGTCSVTLSSVQDNQGETIHLTASRTSGDSLTTSVASSAIVVANGTFTTNTPVSINGTPTVGTPTTLTPGTYSPVTPTGRSYQWQLCNPTCGNISGATNSTYTPVAGDVGWTLKVIETVTHAGYDDGGSTSAASPAVIKGSFTTTSDVVINGPPIVGTSTTITNGVYSVTATSRSYQWELCDSSGSLPSCNPIGGATNNSYTPDSSEVGLTLRVVETVSRAGYNDGGSTSAAATVVVGVITNNTQVAINGTPKVDTPSTLTAGTYSPTPTAQTYQWERCDSGGNNCSNIGGATNTTYTPVAGDVGSTLRVVETATKSGYADGTSTSDRSPLVIKASFATNTSVSVSGTPTVATASTANAGSYSPTPTSSAYQWRLCDSSGNTCADISGATTSSYTPVAGDVGSTLRVVETVSKAGYNNTSSTSAASAVVVKANFSTNTPVSVNGTPKVGTPTTLAAGSYTPAPGSRSYQWQLCSPTCSNIGGATNSTYTPVAGDVGKTLKVIETVGKAGYNPGGSTSSASLAVVKGDFSPTTAVAINGTPTVGTATTLTAGTYSPAPTGQSYQWELCDANGLTCNPIGGATSNTYTPISSQVGSTLRVVETVTLAGYNDGSSTSNAAVVNGTFATNTAVAINGTPTVGTKSTLTAGTYTPSPTSTSYQWKRCDSSGNNCVKISGATFSVYTPVAGDVGSTLRVVETVTKSLYVNGGSTSAASAPVIKGTIVMNTQVAVFGYPKKGVLSKITPGSYTPTPTSRTYHWLRCTSTALSSCVSISGATGKTYRPVAADVGKRLRVVETVSKAGYNNLTVTSLASAKVTS